MTDLLKHSANRTYETPPVKFLRGFKYVSAQFVESALDC